MAAAPSPSLTDASSSGPNYGVPKNAQTGQTDASSSGPDYGVPHPPLPKAPAPPPSGAGTYTVMSPEQIAAAATTEVNNQINTEVTPLQSQYDSLGTSEEKARSNLQTMFGSINPYVAQGAENVQTSYDNAEKSQTAIFSAATQRLNQLKQSRAQEAQALAQEMGGPVALTEFTAGMDDASQQLANLGAGQMLHTLGYAQAGVQEANAWQSRVMPLIQTEQQAKVRSYFEDQKKTIQDQITALKRSAGDKITQRKNELLIQERTFALQKAQQALDSLKAKHDWTATKITLKNDAKRIAQSDREFKIQQAGVTGKYNGKPTLAAQTLTAQEKQQAREAGITNQQFIQHKKEWAASQRQAQATLQAQKQSTWAQYLDLITNPQPGKTVTNSQAVPIDPPNVLSKPDKTVYKDPKTGQWYRIITTTSTPVVPAMTNPSRIVDFLVNHGAPRATAIRMVRTKYNVPNWKYGTPLHPPKPNPKKGPPDKRYPSNPGP